MKRKKYKNLVGIFNREGEWVFEPSFLCIGDPGDHKIFNNGVAKVEVLQHRPQKANKYGFVGIDGRWIVEPQFTWAESFNNNIARVSIGVRDNCKYGVIDIQGNWVTEPVYDVINPFCNEIAIVKVNGKYGAINEVGELIIEPKFDFLTSFSNGIAGAAIGNKTGIIDKTGAWICDAPKPLLGFGNSGVMVSTLDGVGLIGNNGNLIIEPIFERIDAFEEQFFVKKNGKWGILSSEGKWVVMPKFDGVEVLRHGKAKVWINNKQSIIDQQGKLWFEPISQIDFDHHSYGGIFHPHGGIFNDDFTCIGVDDKWGFINQKGDWVIKPTFEHAMSFSEGLASVKIDGKYGFIDIHGDLVIKPQFYRGGYFSEGLACVGKGSLRAIKHGYIDTNGKWVIKPKYDVARPFSEGFAAVDGGYMDKTGAWLIEPNFFDVYSCGDFKDGVAFGRPFILNF